MARFARFVEKLDAMPDGEGTLLDSTLVMYGNWEARGYHNFYDMPVVLAGANHVLEHGRYLDYRPRPHYLFEGARQIWAGRPYNQLLVTVLQAMGLTPDDYQRLGQAGFGVYDGHARALADHYRPFLQDKNAPLPLLMRS